MALLIDILAAGVIDASGNPLENGKVYVYEVGTTTPVTTYQDAALTLVHPNPIVLDSVGRAEAYVNDDVRLVIEDQDGASISDIDALGTNTELKGSTTVIGNDDSDIVQINASVEGDLIPTVDDTYVVGTESKRWKEGHFDNIYGRLNGTIGAVAADTGGWISNLGLDLDTGVLKIVDADGDDLSASSVGHISIKSGGKIIDIPVTYSASFEDLNATSDLTNFGFGIDETVTTEPIRFYGYVGVRNNSPVNGTDGNSVFFISRVSGLVRTPSNVNNIGDTGTIAVTDSIASIFIMQNVTIADYANIACVECFSFQMAWDTSPDDWEIQSFDSSDGFGTSLVSPGKSWDVSVDAGAVSETTTTPQDLGITASIVTTGRPVFVGLTCDASAALFLLDPDTSVAYITIDGIVSIKRNGTIIYTSTFGHLAESGGNPGRLRIPPSAFWTIDKYAPAGKNDYTAEISLNTNTGTSSFDTDDVKIAAFEV